MPVIKALDQISYLRVVNVFLGERRFAMWDRDMKNLFGVFAAACRLRRFGAGGADWRQCQRKHLGQEAPVTHQMSAWILPAFLDIGFALALSVAFASVVVFVATLAFGFVFFLFS